MRIIFIRHGDPDYENDTLTEKGWREARLLAQRVSSWEVKTFYCSPLGRAQATASCSLEKLHRSAVTHDWMREFFYPITDPTTGRFGVPWDFMPSYWTMEPLFYDKDHWHEAAIFRSNPEIRVKYDEVCTNLDNLLAEHGYLREGGLYHNTSGVDKEDNIVIFCHLGITFVMMSHLLGIAPPLLWQNFFIAPASVTILATEEREPGRAYFRTQAMGDTLHLQSGGEPVSQAGYFARPFQL